MEIEVIYEDGVFKPLKKVNLKEGTKLKIIMKREKLEKLMQKLSELEPLKVRIDEEKLEWEYYAKG